MERCLQLAEMGRGAVAPNPMVGAVLVYHDRIIGEGYHQQYGLAHAEVNCIGSVREGLQHLISSSTLYVSLEPCAHYGKTPPCADLIAAYNIPKVVIGCIDPFAAVAGKGIQKLRASGVEVTVGLLEEKCLELNKRFFTFHKKNRPYIILKWAQSGDGFIGKWGERILITDEYSNRLVHRWRSEEAAILVGKNTAMLDDPLLTTRLWPGKNPVRLVVDRQLQLPATLKMFGDNERTIVFNELKMETSGSTEFYKLNPWNSLSDLANALHQLEFQSVLVEGGSRLLQSFIEEGLWDEARVFTNDKLMIRNGVPAPVLKDHFLKKSERIQSNFLHLYEPYRSKPGL